MSPELSLEIRDQLRQYLSGKIPLRAFQNWFVPATWDAAEDSEADRLAADVEHWLTEYTSETLTEEELRDRLQATLDAPLRPILNFNASPQRKGVRVDTDSPTVWGRTAPVAGS